MTQHRAIFGIIEHVSFPVLGISNVIAKVDTGAYSGAIHCSLIELVPNPNGKDILRFIPTNNNGKPVEVTSYKKTYVKSSNGHRATRFLIDTDISIQDQEYTIRIGLSDRSTMKTDVLIGRRFLRKYGILVDVRMNQDEDDDGGKKI